MKKPSTKTVRRTGRLQDRQLTIGLDLGDRSSFYSVLNGAGEVMVEERVTTSPEAMKKAFGKMPRSRIALETGTHSPWVSRLLSDLGHEAIVAHARNVRLIGESRRKDDRLDAQALARPLPRFLRSSRMLSLLGSVFPPLPNHFSPILTASGVRVSVIGPYQGCPGNDARSCTRLLSRRNYQHQELEPLREAINERNRRQKFGQVFENEANGANASKATSA